MKYSQLLESVSHLNMSQIAIIKPAIKTFISKTTIPTERSKAVAYYNALCDQQDNLERYNYVSR